MHYTSLKTHTQWDIIQLAMAKKSNIELGMTTNRIETLTDGVFAIAMTLLVLNLKFPQPSQYIGGFLHKILQSQIHIFINYILSFIILGIFWIMHHQQSHYIRRTDRIHLWINIFMLMFIALIPFSTSLVSNFTKDWVDEIFFAGNIFIIGTLFYANWSYATYKCRLVEPKTDKVLIDIGKRRVLVVPLIALFAIITAFQKIELSSYCYMLIPIILAFPAFRYQTHD
ncbi:MAG: TMEM175 family protein [bacterium]